MQASNIVLGVGVTLAVLAVAIGWVVFPQLLQMKIKKQIRLEEDGELFKRWVDIPVPIYMKIYFFNVTNPDQVKKGGKPILNEMGPYVYQQKRQRVVENIDVEADTIDFRPKITYYFREDMSVGSESDVVTLIDVPFASVVGTAMKLSIIQRTLIRDETIAANKQLFMQRTVAELTFKGYYDSMMEELSKLKGEQMLPNNTFGIFYGKNGTAGDLLQIYSGVLDNTLFGETISWKGDEHLTFWKTDSCNMINGSDGSVFPPFVTRDRVLRIFSPDMCRSIYMTYDHDVEVLGVPGFRFITPREVLEDPRVYQENACYCTESEDEDMTDCAKAGVFYLSPCRKGAPIVISWPHFYDGDESYVQQHIGLEPIKEKHETFIVLEPNTGSLIKASKRFQINVELKPTKYFHPMKKVQPMLMPIMWADESVQLNEDNAAMINSKLMRPVKIVTIATWIMLSLGLLITVVGGIMLMKSKDKKTYKG